MLSTKVFKQPLPIHMQQGGRGVHAPNCSQIVRGGATRGGGRLHQASGASGGCCCPLVLSDALGRDAVDALLPAAGANQQIPTLSRSLADDIKSCKRQYLNAEQTILC